MHCITPYQPKVILIGKDGSTRVFDSRVDALNYLGYNFICNRVGPRYSEGAGWTHQLKDEFGNRLSYKDFADIQKDRNFDCWYGRVYTKTEPNFWNGEGPVPGTGRSRHYRFFRHPRTAAERRQNAFYDAEAGEPRPRVKRTGRYLICERDDCVRTCVNDRSWKRYRKTQWKVGKNKNSL